MQRVEVSLTFGVVQVYIGYIKEFALRFQRAADDVSGERVRKLVASPFTAPSLPLPAQERSPQLSPMPIVRRPPSSPRQVRWTPILPLIL